MKKFLVFLFIGAFAFTFAAGITISIASADEYCYPNGIASFECIEGDLYICKCQNKHWVCRWYADDCEMEP